MFGGVGGKSVKSSVECFDAAAIVKALGLVPHPMEGGYFRETYRAAEALPADACGGRYGAVRSASTAIYYLLTPTTFSALHRLASDEVFHFYAGDPVEQLRLHPGGRGEIVTIGNNLSAGLSPQTVVPRGVWQGARLAPGGRYALLGCTVAPGFEYADYESANGPALAAAYPDFAGRIATLTAKSG
jgi:predicted cupin superfamily sugar epimerase